MMTRQLLLRRLLFTILAVLLVTPIYALEFTQLGISYRVNNDGESVSVCSSAFDAWNWKSQNNYSQSEIMVPPVVSFDGKDYAVTSIADRAFNNSHNLEWVQLPGSIETIGSYAFSCCDKMSAIVLPPELKSIGSYAFFNCPKLWNITIPATLQSIGYGAFYSEIGSSGNFIAFIDNLEHWFEIDFADKNSNPLCHGGTLYVNAEAVKRVVVPNTITNIKPYAFYGANIETLDIPDHVVSIGTGAFAGSKVKSISIGAGLTELRATFQDCRQIESVFLSASVEKIHDYTFYGIRPGNLKKFVCLSANPPSISSRTNFKYEAGDEDCDYPLQGVALYVPASAIETYWKADVWKEFGLILPTEDDATSIAHPKDGAQRGNSYDLSGRLWRNGRQPSGIRIRDGRKVVF